MRCDRLWFSIAAMCAVVSIPGALAKEPHYQRLRVLLMTEKAACISCHTEAVPAAEPAEAAALNSYGTALAALGRDEPLSERMLTLDEPAPADATAAAKDDAARRTDADGDGVPNWVEVLAGRNPGDKADRPDAVAAKRIVDVISCRICHTAVDQPGRTALESNPHNDLGKLLAETVEPKERRELGRDRDKLRQAAEETPILRRFKLAAMKAGRGGKASYWERLLMLRAAADPADEPAKGELTELRKSAKRQRSAKTRDPALGMGPHKPDGFLLDAR